MLHQEDKLIKCQDTESPIRAERITQSWLNPPVPPNNKQVQLHQNCFSFVYKIHLPRTDFDFWFGF